MSTVNPSRSKACFIPVAVVLAMAVQTARADNERSFEIYGFAMGDYIQDFQRVNPDWQDAFRPSKISINGEYGTNGQTSLSVKQSRFGVKGSMPTGDGYSPVNFKFEFDFFGVGVDAGQTTIRLRHFYGEWEQLLAGQTHSVFMDIDVFPNTIDYWGPSGMVFWRHPQVRWTPIKNDTTELAFALEQPANDIDPGNIREISGFENVETQSDEKYPDLTGHYRVDGAWGHYQIAAILRHVGYEYRLDPAVPWQKGFQTGWGVNLSGALKFLEKDQLLLQVVYGHGIASYMNDGGMDLAPTIQYNTNLVTPLLSTEAVPLTGVVAYYDHYWSSKWSSSIGYSYTQVTNTNFQAPGTFHKGQYFSVNLLAYPTERVMVGIELLWGELATNTVNETGTDWRFQFSAKYSFDIKL